jgi:hypothetical protein
MQESSNPARWQPYCGPFQELARILQKPGEMTQAFEMLLVALIGGQHFWLAVGLPTSFYDFSQPREACAMAPS